MVMLKCSKEAFAACPDRKGCSCPEEAVFTEGSECDMFNRQIGSHTMTNADRIRAMSDEELAENMVKFYYNEFRSTFCQHKPECNGGVITDEMCQQCIIKLLKQPAEG